MISRQVSLIYLLNITYLIALKNNKNKLEDYYMEGLVQQADKYIIPDGQSKQPYMSRRGELFVQDWIQSAILEGKGFIANAGAFSTPIGEGTILDLDKPQFGMIIPDGRTIVPIRFAVQLTTPLLETDEDEAEALLFVDTTAATVTAALDGTWTTTVTPKNMRIALTNRNTSVCTVKVDCTAATTDPTESIDLMHTIIVGDMNGSPANALWTKNEMLYEPKNPPLIVGPASLFAYWGGTVAVEGFMQFFWLEFPSTQLQ
jgi:hypothetical protein